MKRGERYSLGPEEQQVWQRERAYWELFCKGDEACLELLDDGFLGWPHTADAPQDKKALVATLRLYQEKPVTPALEPVGVSVADSVAVVHLRRTLAGPEAPPVADQIPLRVLHTWVKRNGAWYLVGGMGHVPATR